MIQVGAFSFYTPNARAYLTTLCKGLSATAHPVLIYKTSAESHCLRSVGGVDVS